MSHVDTPSPITHISLCAGYGGIDIGLQRAIRGIRTILFSEIEAFACANLVSKMEAGLLDAAPIWTDLKTLPWDWFCGKVDILSGGFPCQPFSAAGKRQGDEDPRHLFPYILDGIRRCRPSIVFLENVEGVLSAKLAGDGWRDPAGTPVLLHVFRELERVGYKCTAGIFSASEVGAPHQRKRVFILAYRCGDGHDGRAVQDRIRGWVVPQLPQPLQGGCSEVRCEATGCGNDSGKLAHNHGGGTLGSGNKLGDTCEARQGREDFAKDGIIGNVWPSRPGEPQHEWEPPRVVGNAINDDGVNVSRGELGNPQQPITYNSSSMGNAERILLSATREHGAMEQEGGNATGEGSQPSQACAESGASRKREGSGADASERNETQPSLGGNPNGSARGVDYAELQVSCDNRTDELRLLGNGVVPATAELAFRTLWEELTA